MTPSLACTSTTFPPKEVRMRETTGSPTYDIAGCDDTGNPMILFMMLLFVVKMASNNDHISICWCECSEISKTECEQGHVHCPCEACNGEPVNRMKAWRHAQRGKIAGISDDLHSSIVTSEESSSASGFCSESMCNISNNACAFDRDSISCASDSETTESYPFDDSPIMDEVEEMIDGPREESNEVREFIRQTILKLVDIKTKSGFSIKTMEDLLEWGKEIFSKNNNETYDTWPSSWEHVLHILEEIGFNNPKLYFICLNSDHPCVFGLMESKRDLCPHCGNPGNIPYYYLSVLDKVKRWFSSQKMCEKISAHWKEKEHWLSEENRENWGYPLKKEIWDGKQFARLQYFWNPNSEWILPVACPVDGCGRIISSEMILNSPLIGANQDKRQITCPRCYNDFEHEVKKTRGDPRNLAYDVHWDGWQPFSSGKRGSGAIELQVVNMSKEDRCAVEEVYVIGFVPTYLLPNKCPIFLDPFLEPLIIDIETGFIKGIDVNCSVPMCGKPEGPAIIRHLILCFSGDHNGICEAGKFVKMGKCACRRCCLLESIYIPERCHYYYPNFRKQGRFPAEKKSILNNLDTIDEIDAEERVSVRKEMARDSGYTGLSILHRLHPLYGFLYDEHMLFDEMHTFSLNIVKSALLDLLDDEDSSIDWNVVEERLKNMPWTTEFKSSRYPKHFIKSVRSWKAEEFLIFAYPTSEVVFDGLLSDQQREVWMCIARMIEFIKNHARNGWTKESCDTFHAMCLRYAVLLEERRGAHKCVIILHNLLHLKTFLILVALIITLAGQKSVLFADTSLKVAIAKISKQLLQIQRFNVNA